MAELKENRRKVDKWWLGDILGKGGYSWVKVGYHEKTGKPFALKFMNKASDAKWQREQASQVATEIDALKQISHKHVMKLYAYNLKCKYPNQNGGFDDTIMLVLEMAPGGELFDILYYTKSLDEELARTYFVQLMEGVQAIHDAGVAHRDLKPQNLLLDAKYQLKITDFGLSKIFANDNDQIMSTTYVGTKGYQAPELLLNRRYTNAADIFSCGVILFIMMTGYPPFEQAHGNDQWYRCIAQEKYEKFWKKHGKSCGIEGQAQDLIQRMLCYQPVQRASIKEILDHPWVKEKEPLGPVELVEKIKVRHKEAVLKRRNDSNKMEQLAKSNARRAAFEDPPPPMPRHLTLFNTYLIDNDAATPIGLLNWIQDTFSELGRVDKQDKDFKIDVEFQTKKSGTCGIRANVYTVKPPDDNGENGQYCVVFTRTVVGSLKAYRAGFDIMLDAVTLVLDEDSPILEHVFEEMGHEEEVQE